MVTEVKTITLSQLIATYLISRRHLSEHTQDYYHNCLKNFEWYAKRAGWPEAAEEITREHIRESLNYVATSPKRWGVSRGWDSAHHKATPATVNHYGRVIKRLFRWGHPMRRNTCPITASGGLSCHLPATGKLSRTVMRK